MQYVRGWSEEHHWRVGEKTAGEESARVLHCFVHGTGRQPATWRESGDLSNDRLAGKDWESWELCWSRLSSIQSQASSLRFPSEKGAWAPTPRGPRGTLVRGGWRWELRAETGGCVVMIFFYSPPYPSQLSFCLFVVEL